MSLWRKVAIIGTRSPDENQVTLAQAVSEMLSENGCFISTGAAEGIDQHAMSHAKNGQLLVFLPWAKYNLGLIPYHAHQHVYDPKIHVEWTSSVDLYHPAPKRLTRGPRALHARNYGIVEKANLVVAMPDPQGEGGTGQGIRIAKALGIPLLEYRKFSKFSVEQELKKMLDLLALPR